MISIGVTGMDELGRQLEALGRDVSTKFCVMQVEPLWSLYWKICSSMQVMTTPPAAHTCATAYLFVQLHADGRK